jgi:hypothetical protein
MVESGLRAPLQPDTVVAWASVSRLEKGGLQNNVLVSMMGERDFRVALAGRRAASVLAAIDQTAVRRAAAGAYAGRFVG